MGVLAHDANDGNAVCIPRRRLLMEPKEKMELIRQMSSNYETTPEEFQERLDSDIEAHKIAIAICNQKALKEILKDSLIKLQELKIQDGGVH